MDFHEAIRARLLEAARLSGSTTSAGVTRTIEQALASAGMDTQSGPMRQVTDTIRRALAAAGLEPPPADEPAGPHARDRWHGEDRGSAARGTGARGDCIDVEAREVRHGAAAPAAPADPADPAAPAVSADPAAWASPTDAADTADPSISGAALGPDVLAARAAAAGRFASHRFSNHAGSRRYKLYVPASLGDGPVPLVLMLHGCTQSPDDFAAGTRMNALADRHGFLVAYPEQSSSANHSRCWNWFRPEDQGHADGEPAILAGLTREIAHRLGADPRRVYAAGLSAGGAMALILGHAYPDLYAAVGVHSGLPYRAAHDMASAFAAMKRGTPASPGGRRVRTIVFHGDQDHTVSSRNGAAVVQQSLGHGGGTRMASQQGAAPSGRRWRRTTHLDAAGRPVVEHWVLHGADHAWSGGSPAGSYTDPSGPDASAEMIRFFLRPDASVGG